MRIFTFKKKARIRKRREFLWLKKHGSKLNSRHFFIVFSSNDATCSRLGITVTRKVGSAVVRNRIRRIVRETYRLQRRLCDKRLDINVIAKYSAALVDNQELIDGLEHLFNRLGNHEIN